MNQENEPRAKLEKICDKVFLSDLVGSHKWNKRIENNYCNSIVYFQRVSGVEIEVKAYMQTSVKAVVYLFIGNRTDIKNIVNKISFSICKKSGFEKDIIKRLELNILSEHIETILKNRKIEKERKDDIQFKMDILKRFFSFDSGYKGGEHLARRSFFSGTNRYRTFDIDNLGRDMPTLTIRADTDFLMKIVAFADDLIKKGA
ncbi:hypothetical protein GVX81_10930 [[Haemophilus] felis]|uniref:Uncharacterized protein n=1 Tax=[Haemophilus] felis TaxID=123822 RepID=A0A1T0AX61_9PAST|nr:hypothetical protein [[Haemophilus] felis]OOS02478.1 hypothetical protein B0188_08615 [[Haemophilus] felis]